MDKIKKTWSAYWRYWPQYTGFLLTLIIVGQVIIAPLLKILMGYLMLQGQIPLISIANFQTLLINRPLILLGFLVIFGLWLSWLSLSWGWAIYGIDLIDKQCFSWLTLFKTSKNFLRPAWQLVVLFYFATLMPIGQCLYHFLLWGNLNFPAIMLDYFTRYSWLLILSSVVYLLILNVGMAKISILPRMALLNLTWRQAWSQTHDRFNHALLGWLLGISAVNWLINWLLVGLQSLFDRFDTLVAWPVAIFNRTCIQMIGLWLLGAAIVGSLHLINNLPVMESQPAKGLSCWMIWGIWLISILLMIGGSALILPKHWQRPVTISHRGVAQKDGVQNTLPALRHTERWHPDLVEIDVHETADHRFVVLHDENLKHLAGKSYQPRQLKLELLEKIRVHENGHHAYLVGLSQYLDFAKRTHQRLLVEIKTTPHDSADMLQRFTHQYEKQLQQSGTLIHSMDLNVIFRLQNLHPRLRLLNIQPYNFGWLLGTSGCNVEYSMLDNELLAVTRLQKQPLYAWTVNDPGAMRHVAMLGVDGIVTDNLPQLNQILRVVQQHHGYARRLANELNVIYDWRNLYAGRRGK